jgi:hypothetical protein
LATAFDRNGPRQSQFGGAKAVAGARVAATFGGANLSPAICIYRDRLTNEDLDKVRQLAVNSSYAKATFLKNAPCEQWRSGHP